MPLPGVVAEACSSALAAAVCPSAASAQVGPVGVPTMAAAASRDTRGNPDHEKTETHRIWDYFGNVSQVRRR